jgi:amino acid adenylation domain-containing protein
MTDASPERIDPGKLVSELSQGNPCVVSSSARAKLDDFLASLNRTQRDYPRDRLVHEFFEQQVEKTPDAPAVIYEGEQLTYRQLNERANQLAHYLRERGIGPDSIVGVCLLRCLDMEIALLAVLKAGGAYVPLDPDYPQDRLSLIVRETATPVVLTQSQHAEKLASCAAEVVCIDRERPRLETFPTTNVGEVAQLHNLAYVIFTSGSTGVPKGVMIEHGALLNRLSWMQEAFSLAREDRVLQKTPYTFDVSIWELFWPLMAGATLVFARPGGHKDPGYLIDMIARTRVTTLNFVPSMLEVFLQHPNASSCRSLRRVVSCGEALSRHLRQRFFERLPDVELHNLYGPTEATIDVSWWDCRQAADTPIVPIGRPIANTQLYILDPQMNPAPVGEAGELYIGGVQLARGYLNRPDLTAERFVSHPFDETGRMRLYKTGDLCRYLADGNIEFLGRLDHQVKIRGFRIELGEIESVLGAHAEVGQVVVMAREDTPGDKRLVAYVVARQGSTCTAADLREYLSRRLPEYMIPSAFMFLDSLPLTASGKVDRKALPAPQSGRRDSESGYVPPQTSVQETLCEVFAEVLGVEKAGIHDNFFELGGHSLLATKAIYRIYDRLKVDLPIPSLFENPTVAQLARVVERASREGQECSSARAIPRIAGEGPLPMSYAQRRMWFLYEFEPAGPLYNVPLMLALRGPLRVQALEESLNDIIERHDSLRTTFDVRDGEPVQIIHPHIHQPLPVEAASDLAGLRFCDLIEHPAVKGEACASFDLRRGPLLHMKLFRVREQEHVLVLTMHHIVSDGWSMDVMLDELSIAYAARIQGRVPDLEPLLIRYADYACWQQQRLQGGVLDELQSYWQERLKGELPVLELPTDYARSNSQTFNGRWETLRLGKPLSDSIRQLSRREGKTLFMTLLGAFQVLLHRYSGQADILVGSPIANRTRKELEPLIGFFVNTLVLRTDLSGNPTFQQVLERVEQVCLGAYTHQDLPFEQLVDHLHPARDAGRNPLFDVMFVLGNAHGEGMHLADLQVNCQEVSTDTAKFDLTLVAEERQGELVTTAEYRSDLFSPETIRRMLVHYQHLLESIVRQPEVHIDDLSLLSEREHTEILDRWNQTERAYPQDRCVHQLFQDQASQTPEAAAVVYEDQVLTYRQLNERANQLAHYLQRQDLGPDRLVGVYLERTPELIVSLLAILKAGGAYVPLDSNNPSERLAWMIDDTGLKVLITDESMAGPITSKSIRLIRLDRERAKTEREATENLPSVTSPEGRAYVMYTSGSTGVPKGVEICHRGIVRLLFGVDYVDLTGRQSFLQLAPVSFDASTFEIWGALLHGHRCVLFPQAIPQIEKLGEVLQKEQIDCLWLTASLFNTVIEEQPQILKGVRQLLTGGEALSVPHVRRALEQLPQTQLINGYGPTESTTFTCTYRIPRTVEEHARSIPIGRPIGNTQVYILDDRMRPVPVGIAGQLYIGGAGLARGYWRRQELTAERFVSHPFDSTNQARLYKTGDLCRYLPDGNIEFLGRLDHQVKIRGFRIELGEIESVLGGHAAVAQAAVTAREDTPGDKRLVAYVVARQGSACTATDLREHLGRRLPEYMIPSAFVFLDSLPLTASGKVDRKALPAPQSGRRDSESGYVTPQTPAQKVLCEIFAQVLGIEKTGIHDDFFNLGGNSLLAVRLLHRIEEEFQKSLPLATLFKTRTVAQLCKLVTSEEHDVPYSPLVQIRSGGSGPPLFILPGVGGHSMVFSALASRLDVDRAVYGLELQGLDGKEPPHETIQEMASHFINLIRSVQPQGPYYLAGYSLGGRVAFEMAIQLKEQGQQISMLAMIAATAPGYPRTSSYRIGRYAWRMVDFLRLSNKDKLSYLKFKVQDTREKVRQRRARRASAVSGEGPESRLQANIEMVKKSAFKAWRAYKPKAKYCGDILLIRDTNIDSPLYRNIIGPQAGWERWVTGAIEVHEVPSGHLDILKEPYVSVLAKQVSEYIRKTQDDGWPPAPALPGLPQGELHVFLAGLDARPGFLAHYESLLSPEERDRASRFVQAQDRDRFTARRGLLRELLSRYTKIRADRVELQYSDTGKPALADSQNPSALKFSVTSREGLALYAFACGCDIGIDLERTRPVANLLELAGEQFSGPEHESLCSLPEGVRLKMFYTIWTCKEAYIKARGIIPLHQFTVSIGPAGTPDLAADETDPRQVGLWSFSMLPVSDGWHAALVAPKGYMAIRHWGLVPQGTLPELWTADIKPACGNGES